MLKNVKIRDKSGFLILRLLNSVVVTFSGKRFYVLGDREETKDIVACRLMVHEELGEYCDPYSDADYDCWLEDSNYRDPVYDEVIHNPYTIYVQQLILGSEQEEIEPFQMKINLKILEPGREPLVEIRP